MELMMETLGWIVMVMALLGVSWLFGKILREAFSAFTKNDD